MKVDLTIITPCFNEEDNIFNCVNQVKTIMKRNLPNIRYEHIVSDNCSTDGTLKNLLELKKNNKNLIILQNSRNIGPTLNVWSAMKHARGKYIIPFLPADLQDPVEIIPMFLKKLENNNNIDVVLGVRTSRKEKILLKLSRRLFYFILGKTSGLKIPANAGEFLIAKSHVIDTVLATNQSYPFIRGLIIEASSNYDSIKYEWKKRKIGKSKNNFWSLLDEAINGFVSMSRVPARIALLSGIVFSLFGLFFAFTNFLFALLDNGKLGNGMPTIIVGIFLFGGLQLAFLGLIGEYILSIHHQVKKSPEHMVRKIS